VARALERKTRKMACQFASQRYLVAVTLRTAYRHSQPFDLDWDSHSIERNPALQPWLSTPPVETQVPIDDPWAAVRAGGGPVSIFESEAAREQPFQSISLHRPPLRTRMAIVPAAKPSAIASLRNLVAKSPHFLRRIRPAKCNRS
jgi:hypothetical protein